MRNTPIHKQILSLLEKNLYPLSADELIYQVSANKTTVYRQLETMVKHGIVNKVSFTDRKLRYEPSNREHHHHLICEQCGTIRNIPLNETLLLSQLKQVPDFQITRHSLEFFGVCNHCKIL